MTERLAGERHDLIWGSCNTEPWYPNPDKLRTAEVWFPAGDLLVKFLFTTDNLSVQVHPNDEQARRAGKPRGKTEMWHILRAEPGARIALGLAQKVTGAELREAAGDGSIVDLLNWIPVSAGQTFFTPAGTIHAIGAGITLCEIQQLSDVTYRLYDWGRGRELHLDEGIDVAVLEPRNDRAEQVPVECEYFRTRHLTVDCSQAVKCDRPTICIVLEGAGTIDGQGFAPGDVFRVEGRAEVQADHSRLLIVE